MILLVVTREARGSSGWQPKLLITLLIHALLSDKLSSEIGPSRHQGSFSLTHWGRVTHICVGNLTNIGSDNGLSPDRRQAIIWNNAGILSTGLFGATFSEILIEILTFSFRKMRSKVSSGKRRPSCLGLNVLIWISLNPNMDKQLHTQ